MEATVRATCPKCQTALRIPTQWVGQAVKCKTCGATVRTKAPAESPSPDDTAPTPALPQPVAVPAPAPADAFDFNKPSDDDDGFFGLPQPAPAPAPPGYPQPAYDANGYPLPPGYPAGAYPPPPGYPAAAPGYPYGPPPGYPYALPPGYGPPPAYPYPAPPPGYPQPTQTGYAPPPGYAQPAAAAPATAAPRPVTKAVGKPGAQAQPAAPSNEFKMDSSDGETATVGRGRYQRRGSGGNKFVWIGFCFLLTAGLVAAGYYGPKLLMPKDKEKEQEQAKDAPGAAGPAPKVAGTAFPRRMLFISVTRYMYLNPLTAGQGTQDRPTGTAYGLAFQWRVPQERTKDKEKDNDQLFVLSDTATGKGERLPMKSVVQGTYEEFFKTSRAQDRVLIYFGGHAVEKGGKAYLAPMEAELDGEGWEQTLIPLDAFYDELKKCKAAQKVVVWDVCRLNPEKGKVRAGSEPMSAALFKALTSPPPGVQAITTCKPGENALEFTRLQPDGLNGPAYSGSAFLEAVKFVGDSRNGRFKPPAAPAPADPLPVAEWYPAVATRVAEMSAVAEKVGSGGKQTMALAGAPPAALAPPDGGEKVAARFEFPQPPKGASPAEVAAVASEFRLPPLKPDLGELSLAEFPLPADALKGYGDEVPLAEVKNSPDAYPLRNAVLSAFTLIRGKWAAGAGATKLRDTVPGPINDALKAEVKKEQEFWAVSIAELELELLKLEGLSEERKTEPSKRWQANYDFALASLKERYAYMNEYNKLLGNLVIESVPALDPKLGQDGYTLVASDTLKSGRDIKTAADEAKALFEAIVVNYRGTPWAIQAKQERGIAIGLNWKPASLKQEP